MEFIKNFLSFFLNVVLFFGNIDNTLLPGVDLVLFNATAVPAKLIFQSQNPRSHCQEKELNLVCHIVTRDENVAQNVGNKKKIEVLYPNHRSIPHFLVYILCLQGTRRGLHSTDCCQVCILSHSTYH